MIFLYFHLQTQIYQFVQEQHVLTCVIYLNVPVHTVFVIPDSDVPALQTVARLPPRVVQSLRGARHLPEPLRSALVPHSLRLAVPPQLCVPNLRYIFAYYIFITMAVFASTYLRNGAFRKRMTFK